MQRTDQTSHHRWLWMDAARGIAVLLVVVLHGASIPMSTGNGSEEWLRLNQYLEPIRMPLLLVLSGMLLPRSLKKRPSIYIQGKINGILWPLLLWMTVYGVFVYRKSIFEPALWKTGDYLWFLFVIFSCYLVGLLVKKIPATYIALALLGLFVWFDEISMGYLTMKFLYYGIFFFIGAAASRLISAWSSSSWIFPIVLTPAVILLCHAATQDASLRRGTLSSLGISLLCLSLVLWLLPRFPEGVTRKFFAWFGRHSLVIYVSHFPITIVLHRLLRELELDSWLHVSICTSGTLIVVYLLIVFRPYSSWLYTLPGIPTPTPSKKHDAQQLKTIDESGRYQSLSR